MGFWQFVALYPWQIGFGLYFLMGMISLGTVAVTEDTKAVGLEGWELVSVNRSDAKLWVYFFKRPIKEPE